MNWKKNWMMTMTSVIWTRKRHSHNELLVKPVLSISHRRGRAFAVSCILAFTMLGGLVSGCRPKTEKETRTILALDTYVTITAEGRDAIKAVADASSYIMEMEEKFSRKKKESEISKLNASSESAPVELSPETYAVLETAILYSEKTQGLFDPTIAPVMDLWGFGTDPHVPEGKEIEKTLEQVDYRKVHLLSGSLAYVDKGTQVDLGGAAKGAIAAELMKRVRGYSVTKVILDLGGNVCAWSKSGTLNIGIVSPSEPSALCCIYTLSKDQEMSVITSGAYERYFEEAGVRYGHIMDPETGRPVKTDILSATVIGQDGTVGDILSTVLFAYGSERARDFAIAEEIDCILCVDNGTLWVSSSLKGKVDAQKGWTIEYFG